MPPVVSNRSIKDFFKPFTIPKSRIPKNDIVEDEIVVASPKPASPSSNLRSRESSVPSTKQRHSRTSSARSSKALTPTKRSPTNSPKKSWSIQQFDGAVDNALVHISPSSAQKREMKAVEITSPMPPPPPDFNREAPSRSAATSFSSTSTLSSLPMSSQSSSKRIVKGGVQAVTNSDSGSADSDSDELADPSTFVSRKRRKLTPPPGQDVDHAIEVPSTIKPARQSARLSDKGQRSSTASTPRLSLTPPRTVYKHSLLNMMKQREKEEKAEARLQEVESAFEDAQRKRQEQLRREEDLGGGMKAAMADDSDEGERMMLAMARTEALQDEEKFYFFRKEEAVAHEPFSDLFPNLEHVDRDFPRRWAELLSKEKSRTHAFLSGFVTEMGRQSRLPVKLCNWMADQLLRESRADLCEAYVEALKAQASYKGVLLLSRFPSVHLRQFYTLNELNISDEGSTHNDSINRAREPDGPPPGLHYVLQLIQHSCAAAAPNHLIISSSAVALILAGMDDNVKQHAGLTNLLQDTIDHILNAVPAGQSFDEVCKNVHEVLFNREFPSKRLKCHAVASLPAYSEASHRMRRTLALHLITNRTGEDQYEETLTDPRWTDEIISCLKKAPDFKISESTDYALLNALIAVLDIAIDAGFSDFALRRPDPVPVKATGPFSKASTTSPAESAFNTQVDAITTQLRLMSSRIRDAGTSHLRRTEAKSAIERLVVRLEESVRTKPKPRKGIFGGNTGEQRTFLSSFLKHVDTKTNESDGVSIVPVDVLSDRDASDPSDVSETSAVSGAQAT